MPTDDKIKADAGKDAERMSKDLGRLSAANKARVAKLKKLAKEIEKEARKG